MGQPAVRPTLQSQKKIIITAIKSNLSLLLFTVRLVANKLPSKYKCRDVERVCNHNCENNNYFKLLV